MQQSEMARWLKLITIIAGGIGAFFCFVIIPSWSHDLIPEYSKMEFLWISFVAFIWITTIPCYLSLWKFWGICTRIGRDSSFCFENASALKTISKYFIADCIIYIIATITAFSFGILHPGILLIIMIILFIGFALAIITAALSHLVLKASDLKQENDLTI
jgi:hypothetical protein